MSATVQDEIFRAVGIISLSLPILSKTMGKHKKIMPSSKGSSKKKMHMFSKVTMMSQKGGAIGKPGPNASSSTSSRRRHQAQTIKQNQQARRPVIPFRSTDRILLVGEGVYKP